MSKKFAAQYQLLELDSPASDMAPTEKAEKIFRAACFVLGLDPGGFPVVDEKFQPSLVAFYKLQVIRKVIIGKWTPDWNKRTYKWYPFHWMDSPGFRFNGSVCAFTGAITGAGSRLCCETEEQADFLGMECIALYADFNGAVLAPVTAA